MIPFDRLLSTRQKWQLQAFALFVDTFEEERQAVEAIGPKGITEDRWRGALLAVWEGAGSEWATIVAGVLPKSDEQMDAEFFLAGAGLVVKEGPRDTSGTWRRLIEFITMKSTAIVDTTMEEFTAVGLAAYNEAQVRAGTMAATEVTQAMNFAQLELVKNRVPQLLKIWQAINDDRTRQTHRDANGQIRKLNEPYDVGGAALQWPADAGGPLSEVINCRCWEDYQIPG